jgi:hypothetical protein
MAFEDLVAKFEGFTNPAPDVVPDIDAVLKGVEEVYNSDISVRDQAVQTYKEKWEAEQAETAKLRQHNYDLLMKQPAGSVAVNGKTSDDVDEDESERAATIKIADLFTKRKQ